MPVMRKPENIADERTAERLFFFVGGKNEQKQRQTAEVIQIIITLCGKGKKMYIDAETIVTAAGVITALITLGGTLIAIYKFYSRQGEQQKEINGLKETHEEDIKKINEEQCLMTYGLLACLKGLQEKGCNGPVTDAIDKLEKHLNKTAHELE